MRRLWPQLKARLRPPRIDTAAALRLFIEQRASLIAQKCPIDYVRGKTGLASHALFTEKPFLAALDICRWETFAAVLGDLLILAGGHLRPQEPEARLQEALVRTYQTILESQPAPRHRSEGWGDLPETFAQRLRHVAWPPRTLDLADHSAKRLYDTLPIHISMRKLDEEVVYGAVRFRMVAVGQEMERRFAAPELARELLA
jgi:hypothetical protein